MRQNSSIPLLISFAVAALAGGCLHHSAKKHAGDKPHWSYDGATGPEHWADLDPGNALMKTGKRQSPIDIVGAITDGSLKSLTLDYKPTPISVLNNGHTVQQNYAPGSSVTMGGKTFDLLQFHFHSLSEHTVAGSHFPLEMHCVHKAKDGSLLVIGILFEIGAEDKTLAKVWEHIPTTSPTTNENSAVMVNAADVIGTPGAYYHYSGSLTTPPGTEGVDWYVLSEPRQISRAQFKAFQKIYDHNYRPTQPLNGRSILRRR